MCVGIYEVDHLKVKGIGWEVLNQQHAVKMVMN
jgi:hypothetical protein